MASIRVFCERHELQDWIAQLCRSKDLGIICFAGGDFGEVFSPDNFVLRDEIYQLFLFPNSVTADSPLRLNDVQQRQWGWINVRPGGVRRMGMESVLLFSEIHGEKSDLRSGDPEKWVKWLMRRIKPQMRMGVIGRDLSTGAEATYKKSYTAKALELFDAGVIWKQFLNGNVIYKPLKTVTKLTP